MADGQTRRTLRRSVSITDAASGQEHGDVSGVSGEPGTEPDIDRSADADDRNTNQQPNRTERVSVVEISPERLGEYIAGRAAERDAERGTDSSDERRTRKPRADAGQKRGRKGNKEKNQNIEPLVSMVHTWGSVLLKTPELMLSPEESKKLSDAYSTFCEHHNVPVMTEKRMSEINMVVTVLALYGPRFIAVKNRKQKERVVGNVTQMPNRGVVNH